MRAQEALLRGWGGKAWGTPFFFGEGAIELVFAENCGEPKKREVRWETRQGKETMRKERKRFQAEGS
jgi:hypothetical protein